MPLARSNCKPLRILAFLLPCKLVNFSIWERNFAAPISISMHHRAAQVIKVVQKSVDSEPLQPAATAMSFLQCNYNEVSASSNFIAFGPLHTKIIEIRFRILQPPPTTPPTMVSVQAPPSHFKPGRTSKQHERHYVVHEYHDYANEPDDPAKTPIRRRKGGVNIPFPIVLHRVIARVEEDGYGHIFGWQPHGRAFLIHKAKEFNEFILPK